MVQDIDRALFRLRELIEAKVAAGVFESPEQAADIFEQFAKRRQAKQQAKVKWLQAAVERAEEQFAKGEYVTSREVHRRFLDR